MGGPIRVGDRRGRREGGAVALVSALVAIVLMLVGALVVDLGSTWARRGQLQFQVDRAAILAAQRLPATDAASQTTAAKYVAYYIACHVLPGQRELNPEIPACPSGTTPSSSTILTYAQQLLASGKVSFPTSTQIRVVSPEARIDYGFGPIAGVDGSTQHKVAVAKVSSPGQMAPIGLSLPCLLSAAGNVPNGGDEITGILPINYVTAGPLTPGSTQATLWPSTYATTSSGGPVLSSLSTVPDPVVSGSTPASFTLVGSNWGTLSDVQVWFHKGPDTGTPVQAASLNLPLLDSVTGTATVTGVLPDAVMQSPGTWEVKVGVVQPLSTTRDWSAPLSFDVTASSGLTDAIGCGRLLDSPRADEADPALALQKNLQAGLDHGLAQHPNLVTVTAPSLTPDQAVAAASDPTNAFGCTSSSPHVLDIPGPPGTPNCVRLQGNDAWVGTSFTEGMLGAESGGFAGRLVCSSFHPCTGPTTTVRGQVINDDSFDQFVVDPTLLRSRMFFGLSTYVTNGVPLLSPQEALSPDIYSSHRFMWVPVMSTPLTPTSGGDYPILTFRPIFITQDAAAGWTPYDMLWDQLDTVLASLGLAQSDVQHGLLMSQDGQTLEAFRFMTVEPVSLPLVDSTYSGPVTDYVGVGPKIVRLTK